MRKTLRTQLFQVWFRVSRPLTLGVRGVATDEDGRVCLVRHTYTDGWYLPGGGVERAETVFDALERELVEEAGIEIAEPLSLIGVYSNHRVFPNDHVVLMRVGAWRAVEATSQGEIAEVAWVDPLDPPQGATPGTARRLAELFGDGPPSPYW
ncbi:MAG: NUDIX domain-containing protein [Pseudomonadota bacterium]